MEEANSLGSIKLLIYSSRPAVVEIKLGLERRFNRFVVETKSVKLAVETKFTKLAVETTSAIEEI